MSIKAWKGQISINLKQEYEDEIDRHKEEFRDKSPTEELYNRIDEIIENAPTPEEKAERHRNKEEMHKEKAQKWEEKAKKGKARSNLRETREELEETRSEIKRLEEEGIKSKEQITQEIVDEYKTRSSVDATTEEGIKQELGSDLDGQVKRRLEKQPNLKQLKEKRENLESRVQEYEEVLQE